MGGDSGNSEGYTISQYVLGGGLVCPCGMSVVGQEVSRMQIEGPKLIF